MKAYTDLNQSEKLAEILPLESADMYYFTIIRDYPYSQGKIKTIAKIMDGSFSSDYDTPCWSLAALLDILNKSAYFANEAGIVELSSIKGTKWCVSILNCGKIENCYADEPIDACYEMILKLNKLKML